MADEAAEAEAAAKAAAAVAAAAAAFAFFPGAMEAQGEGRVVVAVVDM